VTIVAVADMFGISGRRGELVDVLARAERDGAAQPGCRRYTFTATLADPDRFVLVSEWDSQVAMDAHYASTLFASFQQDLHGLLAKSSEMTVYEVSGRVRPVNTRPMDPRDAD
jgi:quinol monooxygenase YgiN